MKMTCIPVVHKQVTYWVTFSLSFRSLKYEDTSGQVEVDESKSAPLNTTDGEKKMFVASGRGALVPLTHKGVKLMSAG